MNASCQCGAVSFKTPLPKPLAVYICHCDECRRQSSSAFGCSAIFPRFELPCKDYLSCYTRPTASGHTLNCYFCRNCGTRVIHSTPGKNVLSVKGGCIDGLDWKSARHIWCKRAMVPIPEGVERDEGEPTDEEGPKDREGGVGGASFERGQCPASSAGMEIGLGMEGLTGSGGNGEVHGSERKWNGWSSEDGKGRAKEKEKEREVESRPSDVERGMKKLVKRQVQKQKESEIGEKD